jgi:hypothetical protein
MQLVEGKELKGEGAKELYNNHIDKGTRPSLEEVCKLLSQEAGFNSKTYIIIDALDEIIDEETRAKLLESLRALQPAINLMITSRFLDNISCDFAGDLRLDVSARMEDLRAYIAGRISRDRHLSRFVLKDPSVASEIETRVLANAQEMYVRCLVLFLT